MNIDEAVRQAIREEVRTVVREEVRAALSEVRQPTLAEDGYLSVANAAAFVEVHPDTLRRWMNTGRLPTHRAGRELRVRRSELVRFMDNADKDTQKQTVEEMVDEILAKGRKR